MSGTTLNVPEEALLRPEDDLQELWQLNGRVNALHDYLMHEAKGFFSSAEKTVCILMGFGDVLERAEFEEQMKKAMEVQEALSQEARHEE